MSCRRFLISGRVQGVWYRAATRERALALGLSGIARNLPDGRVEIIACGKDDTIEALRVWLWQGPPHAEVSVVEECSVPDALPDWGGDFCKPDSFL